MKNPPKRHLTHDEVIDLGSRMADRGGRFAQTMGSALLCADSANRLKLLEAFWPLYASYLPATEKA